MATRPMHSQVVSSEPATPNRAPKVKHVGALTRAQKEQDPEEDPEEDPE
jgi:hypothetical protein